MRLIDADALKEYYKEGLIDALPRFKTDEYKDLAIQVTGDLCRDIDEQPTVQAVPIEVLDKIRAEIDQARFIDKDTRICKNALASGLEVAMQIIDKYKKESKDADSD